MASSSVIDKVGEIPLWQVAAGWLVVASLGVSGWYFLFYSDAVAARDAAQVSSDASLAEREKMEVKLANFETEMEKAAQAQAEIDESMEVLPLSEASVDHMMRTFQQQGRLVGLVFERWTPGGETKTRYYAKNSIAVSATGTWNQLGEFFRRISEMKKIVNVASLSMRSKGQRGKGSSANDSPLLTIDFQASTYRFLTDEERSKTFNSTTKSSRRRSK